MKQSGSRKREPLCFCDVEEFAEKTLTAMLHRTLRMQKSGRRARVHARDELPPPENTVRGTIKKDLHAERRPDREGEKKTPPPKRGRKL